MSTLKSMTGTENFKQLPIDQKKCVVHNREECHTKKYLDQVQRECNCTPWPLQTVHDQGKHQVKKQIDEMILFVQVFTSCGPEKERCVQIQTLKDESCRISCAGLYADIWDDSTKQSLQNVMKGILWMC